MDINNLSNLSSEVLAAALAKAKEREKTAFEAARLERWPKCRCGALATQYCEARTTYVYGTIEDNGYSLRRRREGEEHDYPPNNDSPTPEPAMWVCCGNDDCADEPWREADDEFYREVM